LAEFLGKNSTLQELHISGVEKSAFDVLEFVAALEVTSLKRLVITPIQTRDPNRKWKGVLVDSLMEDKLTKIVKINRHLEIRAMNEDLKIISIKPE